ncbi:thermonuclease family protein [Bradyrhizobium erythrophlei]|uniref:thermonuclease family protein n=1 Tax=Bradyrhizobium erythrophlei TaxID=1437360 RepID=UPI0035EFCC18
MPDAMSCRSRLGYWSPREAGKVVRMVVVPFRRGRRFPGWPVVVGAVATAILAFVVVYAFLVWRDRPTIPTVIQSSTRAPYRIDVVDGDTVRAGGYTYRLVGFDTPEKGNLARCEGERQLAHSASDRLRQLVAQGRPSLRRVPCSGCQAVEEGTQRCNYGRLCGSLTIGGRDVGQILINEGLAHPYVCGPRGCPPKRSWCG